jgi:hypothetical protein
MHIKNNHFLKNIFFHFIFFLTVLSIFFISTEYTRAIGASPSTINWGTITSSTIVSAPLRITQGKNQLFSSFKTSVTGLGSEALHVDTTTGIFASSTDYYPMTIHLNPKNLTPGPYLLHLLIIPELPINKTANTAVIPGITVKIIFTIVTSSYTEIIPKKTDVFFTNTTLHLKSGLTNNGTFPITASRISMQINDSSDVFSFSPSTQIGIEPKKSSYFEITTTTISKSFFSDKLTATIIFYDEKDNVLTQITSTINDPTTIFQPLSFVQKKRINKNIGIIICLIITTCGILVAYIFRKKK